MSPNPTSKTVRPTFRSRLPRVRFGNGSAVQQVSPSTTYLLILIPSLFLGAFGLMMTFSSTAVSYISQGVNPYQPFLRTLMIAGLALAIAAASALFPARFWLRGAPAIFLLAILLQLLIIPFGITKGGNTNWLPIPGTNQGIQPSEFLKLATCLLIAAGLARATVKKDNWRQALLFAGVPAALAMGAVMVGADMGTMLIFVGLTLGALWMAEAPGRWFAYIALMGSGIAVFLVAISPSRTRRVLEFLPGFGTPPSTSAPTQTDHGLWALGSGGLTGLGPGASREKWNYLQEAHTDFILAIIGEEFGLIGTITLLVVLATLVFGILQLSANASSRFIRIASGAIGTWILVQALINVGTVIGLVPVIGVPFPLVSYGGSSFLFTALAIGVLLSFARSEVKASRTTTAGPEVSKKDPRGGRSRRRKAAATPSFAPGSRNTPGSGSGTVGRGGQMQMSEHRSEPREKLGKQPRPAKGADNMEAS